MFQTGLVSVSFRSLSPEVIVEAVKKAGLDGIEWGGDIHVPAGDLDTAGRVRQLMDDAGLKTLSYGSYYKVGCMTDAEKDAAMEFSKVLASAKILGAPVVRIWAGNRDSGDTSPQEYARLVSESRMLADMAAVEGIVLSFESHGGTCTDEYTAALKLVKEIDHSHLAMYWQPKQQRDAAYNLKSASALAPYTTNIHVFHWDGPNKYPLREGREIWARYIRCFEGKSHAFLLEFMHDNRVETFPETAATLLSWMEPYR